jgi:ElaB/YqjD/DUF883 family membrane-anchored ribosome-binding protein
MASFSRTHSDPHHKNGLHDLTTMSAGEIAAEAKERLAEAGDEALKRLGGAGEMVKNMVTNQPVLALGAALAAGVVIGWLIKRR